MMVYIYIHKKTLYKASYVPWGLVNRWPLSRGGFVAMTSGPMPASSQLQATVLQPLRPQCRSLVDRLQVQGALLRGFLAHQEVLVTSANQKACIYIYCFYIIYIHIFTHSIYIWSISYVLVNLAFCMDLYFQWFGEQPEVKWCCYNSLVPRVDFVLDLPPHPGRNRHHQDYDNFW